MFENYRNRRVLITGHTGFKGSWLTIWLLKLGAQVVGYALDPKNHRDNYVLAQVSSKIKDYRNDIRDFNKLQHVINEEEPEIIFHLAAQPLVLESYSNPRETIETNTQGSANILEAFRQSKTARVLIVITTDKVYKNKEWIWGYRENDILGGDDPYSASKAATEILINSYQKSFFQGSDKLLVSVRAGNVIGGGDWAENRIIPDCIKAIENNETVIIRNPVSTRPWQHVLEPLGGYLMLGERLLEGEKSLASAWNFGPGFENIVSVETLVKKVISYYGKGDYKCPEQQAAPKESNLLSLDISKAAFQLHWKSVWSFEETVRMTVEWYKNYNTLNIMEMDLQQIEDYEERWKLKSTN